jgi:hypothetical protein
MGNLPASRIVPARPFIKTGVDYAGPLNIRTTKGRGHKSYKGYIALFVCMVTKAIHIEVVSDITSQGFIAAYKRFTSRRGLCTVIYSDNGSNFIGANMELNKKKKAVIREVNHEVERILSKNNTTWHFIPPRAAHFGGLWEAGVKSMKYHLKRVIGETTLTFEELTTLVTQIEACMNSRPLSPLTTDPSDLSVLTPAHFLIGDSLISPPEPSLEECNISGITRWGLVEAMKQQFWKKWSKDYLSTLQQRSKWTRLKANLSTGDLVLVMDDQLPPTKWMMARVIEIHPGQDNQVRVVTIRGPGKVILKRPISKLSLLPPDQISPTPSSTGSQPHNMQCDSRFLEAKVHTIIGSTSSSTSSRSIISC